VRIKTLLILLIVALVLNAILYAGEAYALWQLADWVVNLLSALTSLISLLTVVAVWTLVSRLLKLPSVESLHEINLKLQNEIGERVRAEEELQFHRDHLETMVQTRTTDWRNTTEQLQNEVAERIKAQEQVIFQASLLNQLESAILAGNQNREIVYWNQRAEKMFGWKKEEVLGRSLREVLLHPDQWNQHDKRLARLTKDKHWEGGLEILHKKGTRLPVHASSTVLRGDNDQEIGFAFVCFDMSSQVRTKHRLEKAKVKAEKAAVAKQDFLSTMSHEIRTPLNVVIGMARLLMDEDPKPEQLEYLKSLQFSANNLLVIINDILDFSKIEAGKVKLENINFSIQEVVQGVVQAFLFHAEEKSIGLSFDIDEAVPKRVVGDQVRLTQVLNNLVSNAIKFTERGLVSINVKLIKQGDNRLEVAFEVRDTGIGISQDKIPTIFNSFTQADSDTTRKFGGTGLGLTICKRLVELQHGTIAVTSRGGVGSKFSFTLPYGVAKQQNAQPAPATETYRLNDVRLLLVDDNSSNRMVATSFLNKMGVQVAVAENGAVALKKVQEQDFDIILMDLQMPQMDGYQATQAIRKLRGKYQTLPIIALTADVVSDAKDRVKKAGMNDYLSKPFSPDVLYRKISTNLHLRAPDTAPDDQVMTLPRIIDRYDNDFTFAAKLLDSLRTSFEGLPEQVAGAVEVKDAYSLGRIVHKMLPTIRMVENAELEHQLESLRTALSEEDADEAQLKQFTEAVRASSEDSLRYVATLSRRVAAQREQLPEPS
jgi:PAS domain S-box-containing protein